MAVPRPMKCGASLDDGQRCDEFATITNIKYVYNQDPSQGLFGDCTLRRFTISPSAKNAANEVLLKPFPKGSKSWTPPQYRDLRIAVSAVCGILCVLLIVLWVQIPFQCRGEIDLHAQEVAIPH